MVLRKINSILSIFMILAHIVHIGVVAYMYIIFQFFPDLSLITSYIAFGLTVIHIVLSLIITFRHETGFKVSYKSLNKGTILQRASGIAMLLLLVPHLNMYKFIGKGTPITQLDFILRAGLTIAFFITVFVHVGISLGRLVVTLGWVRNETKLVKFNKIVLCVCLVLCVLTSYLVVSVLASLPRI